jgi:hypothetical protein
MKTTTPSSNDDSPNEPCRPTKNITSQTTHNLKIALLIALIVLASPLATFAQVDKIKDKVSEDKSSSGNKAQAQQYSGGGGDDDGYDWSADFTESLVANAIIGVFYGIYYVGKVGQRYAMDKSEQHPELLSIELTGQALIDVNEGTIGYLPTLQLNGGAFATQVRFSHVEDYSGSLNSIDWQVVKLRIPIENLKIEYGIGFIAIMEPSKTYFESSLGFDWRLLKQRANLQGAYRWSQESDAGPRFRQEYNVVLDYETKQWGKFRLAPTIGYTFQNYFEMDYMRFVNLGLRLRFY